MLAWHDFAVVAGGAAAALIGLLFVAVSLRESILAKSRHLRGRAGQTLALFLCVVIAAMLIVVPNPTDSALGAEMIALAVIAGIVLVAFGRIAGEAEEKNRLTRMVDRYNPTFLTPALIAASGILLVFGYTWALGLTVLAVVLALVAGVFNAWLILVRVHE